MIGVRKCLLVFLLIASCLVTEVESIGLDNNLLISSEILSNSKNYNKLVDSFRQNWESPLVYLIQRGYIPKEDAQPDKNCRVTIKKMQQEYSAKSKTPSSDAKLRKNIYNKNEMSLLKKKKVPRQAAASLKLDCKNTTETDLDSSTTTTSTTTSGPLSGSTTNCTQPEDVTPPTTTAKPQAQSQGGECEEYYDNMTECYEYEVYEDGTRVTTAVPPGKNNQESTTAPLRKTTTETTLETTTERTIGKPTPLKCKIAELTEDQKKQESELTSQSPFKFHFFCPTQHTPLAGGAQSKVAKVAPTKEQKEALQLATEVAKNTVAELQRNNYQAQNAQKQEKQPLQQSNDQLRPKRTQFYKPPASFPAALHWNNELPPAWRKDLRPLRSEIMRNSNKYHGWRPGPHPQLTNPSRSINHVTRNQHQTKTSFKPVKLEHPKINPSTQPILKAAAKHTPHVANRVQPQIAPKTNYNQNRKDNGMSSYKQHSVPNKNDYLYDDDDYDPDYLAVNAVYVVNKKGDKADANSARGNIPHVAKPNELKSNQKPKLRPEAVHHKPQTSNANANAKANSHSHSWTELNAKSKPNPYKYKPLEENTLAAQKPKPQYSNTPHYATSQPVHNDWKNENTKPETTNQQWDNYKSNTYETKTTEPSKSYNSDNRFLTTLGLKPKSDFLDATHIGAQNSNNFLKSYSYDSPEKTSTAKSNDKKPDQANTLSYEPLLDPSQYNYGKDGNSNDWKGDYHDSIDYKVGGYKYDPSNYPSQAILNLYRYKNMNKNLENFFVPIKELNEKYEQQTSTKVQSTPSPAPANKTAVVLKNVAKLSNDAEMQSKCLSIIDMAVRNATGSKFSSFSHLHDSTERPKIQFTSQLQTPLKNTQQQQTQQQPIQSLQTPSPIQLQQQTQQQVIQSPQQLPQTQTQKTDTNHIASFALPTL